MLEAELRGNVKYDPKKKGRVRLVDDVKSQPQSRIKK